MAILPAKYKRFNGLDWDEFYFETTIGQVINLQATLNSKLNASAKGETANKTLTWDSEFKVLQTLVDGTVNERVMKMPPNPGASNNNYLTGVSGSGNGTVTFTRQGLPDLTWDASHAHTIAQVAGLQGALDGKLQVGSNLSEANLVWGGKNLAGTYAPIDAAMVSELGANRLAFIPASAVSIEYSRDGGTTWSDYDAADSQKIDVFNGNGVNLVIGKNVAPFSNAANYQLRFTINTAGGVLYTVLNKFVMLVSSNGSAGSWVTIDARLQSNVTANVDNWVVFSNQTDVAGWSGYNVINTSGITTYGNTPSTQYGQVRFTFGCTAHTNLDYSGLQIFKILGFGGVGWNTPSTMAKFGRMYTYDWLQMVQFPKEVYNNGSYATTNILTNRAWVTANTRSNIWVPSWSEVIDKPSWIGANKPTYDLGEISETTTYKRVTASEKSTWNNKVTSNTSITGATKTKITYDSKGLVTAGADLVESDIPSLSPAKITQNTTNRFVTDAEKIAWNAKQSALGFTPENQANKKTTLTDNDVDFPTTKAVKTAINTAISQTLKPMGNWNASTNTPTLANSDTSKANQVYYVSVAGTQFGITFGVGDELVYNTNGVIFRRDNVDAVISVNGKEGVVVLTQDDVADGSTYKRVTNTEKTAWNNKQNALGFTPVPTTRTIAGLDLSANRTRDAILGVSANGYYRRTGANTYDIRTVAELQTDLGLGGYIRSDGNSYDNGIRIGTESPGDGYGVTNVYIGRTMGGHAAIQVFGDDLIEVSLPLVAYNGINSSGYLKLDGRDVALQSIYLSTGNSKTLSTSDTDRFIGIDSPSPVTITVPTHASQPIPISSEIHIYRRGVGAVNIAAASGVVIESVDGKKNIANRYQAVTLKKILANTWALIGALS